MNLTYFQEYINLYPIIIGLNCRSTLEKTSWTFRKLLICAQSNKFSNLTQAESSLLNPPFQTKYQIEMSNQPSFIHS